MEILFVLLLILLNGVLAMAEIAIVSARKTKLQQQAGEGNVNAQKALDLSSTPNRFLSTVQIGITLVGVFAGAFGEAAISGQLVPLIDAVPLLNLNSELSSFFIVVLTITYLSLVVGEIVPKRIALAHPEKIARIVAGPMETLSWIATPFVFVLSASTDAILRTLKLRTSSEVVVSEDEIRMLIREGARTGIFDIAEKDIVERTFQLADKKVTMLMTPRKDVVWLNARASHSQMIDKIARHPYSNYPVCDDSLDKVVGVVRTEAILMQALTKKKIDIEKLTNKPLFIPESMGGLKALELFRKSGVHIAVIIDEYANIQGVVSLSDIVSAIVGNTPALGETPDTHITKREDGTWLIDGLVSMGEFKDHFKIKKLPGEQTGEYETIGGFIMYRMGHIPSAGQTLEWDHLRFEIVDMDGHRIDKVLITPIPKEEEKKSS